MINETTIQNMGEYAGDSSAVRTQPDNENYAVGVKNGYTAPAGWWNWLFNQLTLRVGEERADVTAIIDEIKSVLAEENIQPSSLDNTQLKTAILAVLRKIATNVTPGMVVSSNVDGEVQVNSTTGVMEVNGIGDFSELPQTFSGAYTLVDAIDILYEMLQNLAIGVPPHPTYYDTVNPVLDTDQIAPTWLGEVNLDVGWYYVDISGGGGGAHGEYMNGNVTCKHGGCGARSQGWIFVMSPGKYLFGVGRGGETSIFDSNDASVNRVGSGGVCGMSSIHAIKPAYFNGNDGTVAVGGTGAASILFSCPTQEAYCTSGGSGGNWGVKNYVTLVSVQQYTDNHTEDGVLYIGSYAEGESSPGVNTQFPWGVNGWETGPGASGGSVSYENGEFSYTDGQQGWIKIYRGTNTAPST